MTVKTQRQQSPPPHHAPPDADNAALLTVRNLHKTYHLGRVDVPVLHGVSLSVRSGEFLAILGASGSGKSTLLHLLGGLDRADPPPGFCVLGHKDTQGKIIRVELREDLPDPWALSASSELLDCFAAPSPRKRKRSYKRALKKLQRQARKLALPESAQVVPDFEPVGPAFSEVAFDGRRLTDLSVRELDRYRNRDVGFVFQFYHLLPELNVVENVLLGPMIRYGRWGYLARSGRMRAAAEELISKVGLGHRLRHRPSELSGGERQRVAIARALVNEPRLLLADEPTGNLDHVTGGKILDMLMEIRRERRQTMIVVTHDEETAKRADRIIRLMDGRVVQG